MTLEEFEKELIAHDWWYEMSEDSGVHKRGLINYNRLVEISKESPEHALLFTQYKEKQVL